MVYCERLRIGLLNLLLFYELMVFTIPKQIILYLHFIQVLIVVNNLILARNNPTQCTSFKFYLNSCFKIKDFGPLKFFLGIDITCTRTGLFLSQREYAL